MILALLWTGCGETTLPTRDTSTVPPVTEAPPTETEESGTEPPPTETVTDLFEPPTDFDADCWSWSAAWLGLNRDDVEESLIYTRLQTYDPTTLSLLGTFYDRDADGLEDEVTTYTWDKTFEHVVLEQDDLDADGNVDALTEATYDVDGHLTEVRYDLENDGLWDEVWTYTLVDGLRASGAQDLGDDGIVDATTTYTYDKVGRVLSIALDEGVDAVVDTLATFVYAAPSGPSGTRTTDEGADGSVEETLTREYDDQDRLVHSLYTTDDGDLVTYDYTYNVDGDVETLAAVIDNAGGYSAWDTVYTYEAPGRETRSDTDLYTTEGAMVPSALSHVDTTWFCP